MPLVARPYRLSYSCAQHHSGKAECGLVAAVSQRYSPMEPTMSTKKSNKKDGEDKNKKKQATKSDTPRKTTGEKTTGGYEEFEGLAGTNVKSKPGVRSVA